MHCIYWLFISWGIWHVLWSQYSGDYFLKNENTTRYIKWYVTSVHIYSSYVVIFKVFQKATEYNTTILINSEI